MQLIAKKRLLKEEYRPAAERFRGKIPPKLQKMFGREGAHAQLLPQSKYFEAVMQEKLNLLAPAIEPKLMSQVKIWIHGDFWSVSRSWSERFRQSKVEKPAVEVMTKTLITCLNLKHIGKKHASLRRDRHLDCGSSTEEFEGGVDDFALELGGRMIPGFEDQIKGIKAGEEDHWSHFPWRLSRRKLER